MPPKTALKPTLVIVESPAKCKKIEEYLGPGYKCLASYGHIRELPSLKNINIENNFSPSYSLISNPIKKRNIELLKKEIKQAGDVILATDDDREGEAIAWHLCEVFNLNISKTKRILFNEITENAIKKAIQNPSKLNMNLVQAQQARQILDVLVGFKVSPVLWKLISSAKGRENSLSAGRCQTPALKLVYENQLDINNSQEKQSYNVVGYFTNSNLPFELHGPSNFDDQESIIQFLDESADFSHIYTCSKPGKTTKQPPDPFTTSRLQQVASNELHYSPKETMRICQLLYEGGYITYMRTDSKIYSSEFINTTSEYITQTYNEHYFNKSLLNKDNENENENDMTLKRATQKKKTKKPKTNHAQEAHEAIRPTNIFLSELPEHIDNKERKMYKLIWTNTLESCMVQASYYAITANITAPLNMKYSYTTELIDFPGWKIVQNKFSRENKEYQYLQTICKDMIIPYKKITAKATIKGHKLHYTEAKLVQLLEEKGIGRPSTFSSLIDKIQERGYVKKEDIKGKQIVCKDFELENGEIFELETTREFGNEKSKLVIQPLGIIVMEFLEKHFNPLFNYQYTSLMEEALDKIAKGEFIWFEVCASCNNELDELINHLKNEHKIEYKIDDKHTFLIGKYGPVIKCVENEKVTFKSVKKDLDFQKIEKGEYKIEEILDETTNNGDININNDNNDNIDNDNIDNGKRLGEYEGHEVILKTGKFGLYVQWNKTTKSLRYLKKDIETITLEDVKQFLNETSNIIREITNDISIRKGPKGDYLFYKTARMKKPLFYDIKSFSHDYKICDLTILKSWIKEKYNINI